MKSQFWASARRARARTLGDDTPAIKSQPTTMYMPAHAAGANKQGKEWPGHALGMLWACSEQVLVRGCYCSSQANSRRRTIFLEIPDESVLYSLVCKRGRCLVWKRLPSCRGWAE